MPARALQADGGLSQHSDSLFQITCALAAAVKQEDVYEAVVDRLAQALGAFAVGLWLLDAASRSARLARYLGYPQAAAASLEAIPLEQPLSLPILDAIRTAEPVWIPSQSALLRDYPHLASAVTPGRTYQISCLPLIADGRVLGAIALTFQGECEATQDERDLLRLVAMYAAHAIERLRLLEAERQAAQRMEILSYASRLFGDADVGQVERLERSVHEVGRLLGCATTISLVQSDGWLHNAATFHPDPEAHEMLRELARRAPIHPGEGVTGKVRQDGRSVLLQSEDACRIAARAVPAYRGFFERFPISAVMVSPMRVRGRVIGVIAAMRTRPGETFAPADVELLEAIGDRAAAAIEASRLYDESEQARQRAEQLYQFANAAVLAQTIDAVYDAALDAILGALGTDRAAILINDDARIMRFRAWRGLSDEYRAAVEGLSPASPDTLVPEPWVVSDCMAEPVLAPYTELLAREQIRAMAFLPLVSHGRALGMFVAYWREPHRLKPGEAEVGLAIGHHLASTVSRFSAVADLERTIRDMELFQGVLAHDLRNPLGSIVTAAQLVLARAEGEGDHARPLLRVISASQRMTRMIDQLLDFTRARSGGGIQIHRSSASLSDIAGQAVSELELVFPDRRFEVSCDGDPRGSWDPDRLLQVASNLIANASQHGAAGPIAIHIDGTEPAAVTFTVQNAGEIPSALVPVLFDPFRGRSRGGSHSRGLGLGLFIVREIAAAHGGEVSVASSAEAGTRVTVRLPRA